MLESKGSLESLTKLERGGIFGTTIPGRPYEGVLASCEKTRARKEQAVAGDKAEIKGASGVGTGH
ncbi:Hypothetical predicted protein [Marmota monax]|uniref:Uncharacterized protein n=1 Tax=Marmota monax TaxID=9995 RepID=A0A5E4AW24_MARMO|nr:hypothetical protein GHT09_018574 [Marmota monax]VTJ61673.1 Hypothetical predicted protein [Marmota monax]